MKTHGSITAKQGEKSEKGQIEILIRSKSEEFYLPQGPINHNKKINVCSAASINQRGNIICSFTTLAVLYGLHTPCDDST